MFCVAQPRESNTIINIRNLTIGFVYQLAVCHVLKVLL